MVYGNAAVIAMVISVVVVVLGIAFTATWCLSRTVDRNAAGPGPGSAE